MICCVTGEILTKKNEKRVGVRKNYQICLDSFDVYRDKIIRTHESRDMGAKYLNENDVDSKDECLKFCCDTEGCDVYVFEEKVCLYVQLLFKYQHTFIPMINGFKRNCSFNGIAGVSYIYIAIISMEITLNSFCTL